VPASPMGYARTLADSGCFDLLALTAEDRKRAALYQEDTTRQVLRQQSGSLQEFLSGLQMTLTVGPVDEATLPRVAQLLGKTNQFNLTTRRHSAAELQSLVAKGAIAVWARVKDRFGDNGLVAAAVLVPDPDLPAAWRIDTFLMSCRVIGRGVETALLALLEKSVHERGGRLLVGEFIPTAKNQPAATFLPEH
jgi:FkbH-like protein